MKTAGYRGQSRSQEQNEKKKRTAHFQTTVFGGYEETQIICCLWEIVKSMKALEEGVEQVPDVKKQIRSRIRVEMRRYFVRKKRRNVILIICSFFLIVCTTVLFGFVIGVDQVSGDSMYPYLNHGDWILYNRLGKEYKRDEVVVFERNGENYVKRIAGLPGDMVEISVSGKRVVINGIQMRESYVTLTNPVMEAGSLGDGDPMGDPLTIMDGQYLVLGDNRSVSIDSRHRDVGTVAEKDMLGQVVLIVRRNAS